MKASRLVDLVHGGRPARRAWRSLRKELNRDLERRQRRHRRWATIRDLLDYACDREPSEVVDAYLVTAAHQLKKLAASTDRPTACATCLGVRAALLIRVGDAEAARTPVDRAVEILKDAIEVDWRARGVARRHVDDLQYRMRYLGNEVMALRRYRAEELVVVDGFGSTSSMPDSARPAPVTIAVAAVPRPATRRRRAKVPSWDDILFGVTKDSDQHSHG